MSILISPLLAWLIAQSLKFVLTGIKHGIVDFRKFISPGGMPSSHSALVSSLSTKVGLVEGYDSTLFAICVVFSLIIMYDAAGVRQAAGKQARVLNRLVEDFYKNHTISEKRLRELLGHTPLEVLAGMFLGIVTAILV